jgi:pyruvate kinase
MLYPYPKQTKIVATLGPATDASGVIPAMITAGLDVVRLNFSHGILAAHKKRVQTVRQAAQAAGRAIGIIGDLQGPKIRIAGFKKEKISLKTGAAFTLDAGLDPAAGNEQAVGITYQQLPEEVSGGDSLLLDDGRIVLQVQSVETSKIYCIVKVGGNLSNHKGINRQGGGLAAPALTEKDYSDIQQAVLLGCDYLAVSFPRDASDMQRARAALQQHQGNLGLIAKIERCDALPHLEAIIAASDAVMVARGDLGVEIGEAEVPGVQKKIIQCARKLNKVVITATQMMESMIHHTIPTRAEVSDVANAVLDGTDAVMLSAETAVGNHPALVIETMARICRGAEKQIQSRRADAHQEQTLQHPEEAIAMAAMYIANRHAVKAIIAFTETGTTPLWMSRIRSGIPIYSFTASRKTEHKMSLYRGVYPYYLDFHTPSPIRMQDTAIAYLKAAGQVTIGDHVLVTYGRIGKQGGTNTLKILDVL